MTQPVLRLDRLSKTYGRGPRAVHAVRDLDLTVEPGQVFAFLGPNGAGKTTTMHMVLDYIRPTAGRATIFGLPSSDPQARERLGFLPELFSFDLFLTGAETLRYYARLSGLIGADVTARADRWLRRLGLWDARDRRLSTYSKGMMQRVGLAQALVGDPELVMLDEPTSGMDPVGKREVLDLFRELRQEGRTVFLSSHILSDIEAVADHVALIDQGALRYCGPLSDMLQGDDFVLVRFAAPPEADVPGQVTGAVLQDGTWQVEIEGDERRRELLAQIQASGWDIAAVVPRRRALDDAFLDLLKPDGDTPDAPLAADRSRGPS